MPRRTSKKNTAAQRRWSARLWWIGVHVFDFGVLLGCGTISPSAQGVSDFVVLVVVAVVNALAYIRVQTSSPGYVPAKDEVMEAEMELDLESGRMPGDEPEETDADRLVAHADVESKADHESLHYCSECRIVQPLRAKHCPDCEKCVLQYDHHCDCVGTCVGQHNRRYFVLFLFTQSIETYLVLGPTASAFSLQDSVDEWFAKNALFIIAWVCTFFGMLIAVGLFCYQAYLVSTNQTSWEHARRGSITYLQYLRDDRSPFDRGFLRNWWTFLRGGDMNRWVHSSRPPIDTGARDDDMDSSIM